jgi:hypothetical protein
MLLYNNNFYYIIEFSIIRYYNRMSSTDDYLKLVSEGEKLSKQLYENKKKQDVLSKIVWKECLHEWERCSDYDDLCHFVCKKCTLYNNAYLYR